MTDTQTELDTRIKPDTEATVTEPNQWKVIMLNDDKTTMDFVVGLLVLVFHMSTDAAVETMLRIHAEGQAVVGLYPYEVAEEKRDTCLRTAQAEGYPLQVVIQED